jgi:hypothetical protein
MKLIVFLHFIDFLMAGITIILYTLLLYFYSLLLCNFFNCIRYLCFLLTLFQQQKLVRALLLLLCQGAEKKDNIDLIIYRNKLWEPFNKKA